MAWISEYPTSKPLFYWGDRPITATFFLIGLHTLGLLVTSLLMFLKRSDFLDLLIYSNQSVFESFKIWQWLSYAFLSAPTFSFLLNMLILYFFGKPLEESLGVKRFLFFYFALVMTSPILLTFVSPWIAIQFEGAMAPHFGLLVAVVFLFPESEAAWIRMPMRFVMWILFALYTLQFVVFGKTSDLLHLWVTSLVAWVGVRYFIDSEWEWWSRLKTRWYTQKHQIKVVRSESTSLSTEIQDYDAVLEKISKKGLGSLSASEKKILENKRQELLNQEKS